MQTFEYSKEELLIAQVARLRMALEAIRKTDYLSSYAATIATEALKPFQSGEQ